MNTLSEKFSSVLSPLASNPEAVREIFRVLNAMDSEITTPELILAVRPEEAQVHVDAHVGASFRQYSIPQAYFGMTSEEIQADLRAAHERRVAEAIEQRRQAEEREAAEKRARQEAFLREFPYVCSHCKGKCHVQTGGRNVTCANCPCLMHCDKEDSSCSGETFIPDYSNCPVCNGRGRTRFEKTPGEYLRDRFFTLACKHRVDVKSRSKQGELHLDLADANPPHKRYLCKKERWSCRELELLKPEEAAPNITAFVKDVNLLLAEEPNWTIWFEVNKYPRIGLGNYYGDEAIGTKCFIGTDW